MDFPDVLPTLPGDRINVEPWNEGSWKAAEQVGYEREGLFRSWQPGGQERRDMYMYSLVKWRYG